MEVNWRKHVFASIAGLILALLAMELGLRLLGMASERKQGRPIEAGNSRTILCIGDSLTYGIGASYDTDYPGQLNVLFKKSGGNYTVLNRGIPGANTTIVLRRLPATLEKTRPSAVILVCGLSNYWNLENAWGLDNSPMKTRLLNQLFKLRLYRLYAWRAFPHRTTGPEPEPGQLDKAELAKTEKLNPQIERWISHDYVEIAALCDKYGAKLFLANYPADNAYLRINKLIARLAQELKAPLIDNAAHFLALQKTDPDFDKKYLVQDGHGNDLGYGQVAESTYRALSAHGFK